MDLIRTIEEQQKNDHALNYKVGDTVKVHFEIIEGKTKRIQIFEGLVIAIKGSGVRKTFTVRKDSYGVGVERVFPVYSPRVIKVEVVRDKIGKGAKVKELVGQKAVAYLKWSRDLAKVADAAEAAINAEEKAENAAAAAKPKAKK